MKRLTRYLLWVFLWLPLALAAGVGFLLSTQTGLQGLLALAKRVLPGELAYEHVQGCLLGPLVVDDLRYKDKATDIRLASTEFDWLPSALLSAKLRITTLKAAGIEIHLPASTPAQPQDKPFALSDLRLPLQMEVDDLGLTDIRIHPAGVQQAVSIDGVWLTTRTHARTIVLDTLKIKTPQGDLHLDGQLTPIGAYPLSLALNWTFQHPEYAALTGQGKVTGDLESLSLTLQVSGSVSGEMEGEARHILQDPAWSAQLKLQVPDMGKFVPGLGPKELSASLETQGRVNDFLASGKLATTLPDIGKVNSSFKVSGDTKVIQVGELSLTAADNPLSVKAQGEVNLTALTFVATGHWQNLIWPFTGKPQVESPQGNLNASGNLQNYAFTLNAQLQGKAIPRGNWTLEGQGSRQALENLRIVTQILEGELKGDVSARWQPEVSWQANLTGSGLNPGAHWPEAPGKLNFAARNAGSLKAGQLQTSLDLTDLSGTLNGQAVQGKAQLALKDQDLSIQTLQLKAGNARLDAAGDLGQRWDIRWKLDMPTLSRLLPAAKGAITGAGSLTGPRAQPQAELNLTVQELAYGETEIRRLRVAAKVDMSGATRSQLNLSGDNLRLAGQAWQGLTVEGSGTPGDHVLKANLSGDVGRFGLALNGAFKDKEAAWQGRLTALTAQQTAAGDWNLEKPMALRVGVRQASAERACLGSRPTRVCLEGQWDAARGANGRLTLEQLTMDRFASLLPENLRIATTLSGEATGASRPDGSLQGQANLAISPGKIKLDTNGYPVEVALVGGFLRAEANGRDAVGQVRLDLGDTGQVEADWQVKDLTSQPRLAGKFGAEVKKLGLISAFAPQLQNIAGRLVANVDVSGTLSAPVLRGDVRLIDAAADISQAGTSIQAIQLTASGDGQGSLRFSGSARSGSGDLNLSGRLEPASGQLDLAIKGENFQAANTPSIQAVISPAINVSVAQRQVRADGQILIPKAYLSPPDSAPGGVSASPDVVIVKNGKEVAAKRGPDIFAKIRVILGDDVHVAAAGFKGQLKGNLLVEQTPQLAPRGTGIVEVVAGDYKVYGQDLRIERGRVLFSGGPIDNPGLDLRAVRKVDEVTAGAQVGGTLKNPRLQLFSTPSMSDSQIISYLVFGRPPSGSGAETAMLQNAAAALAMSEGNKLTKGISDAVGVDEFKLASGASPKDAAFVIGKYLSPDLYVSYGVGLFEAVNTFKLRYRLSKRLYFESSSTSTSSGADLTYTTER